MIRVLLAFVAFLIAMCLFAAWLRHAHTQTEKDGYPKAAGGKLPPIPRMAAADAARVGGVASAPPSERVGRFHSVRWKSPINRRRNDAGWRNRHVARKTA
jgi:hypothetical protein